MFDKNLKYYRLKKSMTKKMLAEKVNLSSMAITNYENGSRMPNMDILKKLANALDIRVSDFLATRNNKLMFEHSEFYKKASFSITNQELVKEMTEEYFERFYTTVELLGGEILPDAPRCHYVPLTDDIENDAESLRIHLCLGKDGPIGNLITILENKGILIYICDINDDKFLGMNGFVNKRPYIIVNKNLSPENSRLTIAHELAHLIFNWPKDLSEKSIEEKATNIAKAFLFPKNNAIFELGIHRNKISNDMTLICQEYGISMSLLVKRAKALKIISNETVKNYNEMAKSLGWKKNEPTYIKKEETTLFEQLVYRAINENEINMKRGAELLKMPYDTVLSKCQFIKD